MHSGLIGAQVALVPVPHLCPYCSSGLPQVSTLVTQVAASKKHLPAREGYHSHVQWSYGGPRSLCLIPQSFPYMYFYSGLLPASTFVTQVAASKIPLLAWEGYCIHAQ